MRLFILLAAIACGFTAQAIELKPYYDEATETETSVECGDIPADATPFAKTSTGCTLNGVELTTRDVTTPPSGLTAAQAEKFVKSRIRTWTATDSCGSQASKSRTFHIYDTTPPTISGVLASVTEQCDELAKPCVAVAHDDCDAGVTVQLLPEVSTFDGECHTYTITRTYVATDSSGNTATATQVVQVVDEEPPAIFSKSGAALVASCDSDADCPSDQTCNTVDSQCVLALDCRDYGSLEKTPVVAVDNCDTNVEATYVEIEDTTFNNNNCVFGYKRTYEAEDSCGHKHTVVQSVTYTDNHAPELSAVNAIHTVDCHNVAEPCPPTASDACDAIHSHETKLTISESTDGNFPCEYTKTYTYTATDRCGKTSTTTQKIEVRDTDPPVFTYVPPTRETLECEEPNYPEPSAEDNCGCVSVTTLKKTVGKSTDPSGFTNYEVIYTYTATDECGFATDSIHTVNVQDTTPPTLDIQPSEQPQVCRFEAEPTVSHSDSCCFARLEENPTPEVCPEPGVIYRVTDDFKAIDCVGLFTEGSHTRTLPDSNSQGLYSPILPIDLIDQTVEYYDDALVAKYLDTTTIEVTEGCLAFRVDVDSVRNDGSCDNAFSLEFTYTLTLLSTEYQLDNDGNTITIDSTDCFTTSSVTRTLTFIDTTPPECDTESDQTLTCTEFCSYNAPSLKDCEDATAPATVSVSDGCDNYNGCLPCQMTVSYQVEDDCGNPTAHEYTVSVEGPGTAGGVAVEPSWVKDSNGKIIGAELACVDVLYTETLYDDSACSCGSVTEYEATTPCGAHKTFRENYVPEGDFCAGGDPIPVASCANGWTESTDVDGTMTCTKTIGACKGADISVFTQALSDHSSAVTFTDERCSCTAKLDSTADLTYTTSPEADIVVHKTTCGASASRTVTATDCLGKSKTVKYQVVTADVTVSITPESIVPQCGDGCPTAKGWVDVRSANGDKCINSEYGFPIGVDGELQTGTDCTVAKFSFAASNQCGDATATKDYNITLSFEVGVSVADADASCTLPAEGDLPQPIYDEGSCIFGDDTSDVCKSLKACTETTTSIEYLPAATSGCVLVNSTKFTIENLYGGSASATRRVTVTQEGFTFDSTPAPVTSLCTAPLPDEVTGTQCGVTYYASTSGLPDTFESASCNTVIDGVTNRKFTYTRTFTVEVEEACISESITQEINVLHPHPTVEFLPNRPAEIKCSDASPDMSPVVTDVCGTACTSQLTSQSLPTCTDNVDGESRVTHSFKHTVELAAEHGCSAITDSTSLSYDVVTTVADHVTYTFDFDADHTSGGSVGVTIDSDPACVIEVDTHCEFLDDGTEPSPNDCCTFPRAKCSIDICAKSDSATEDFEDERHCDVKDVEPGQSDSSNTCLVEQNNPYAAPTVTGFSSTTTTSGDCTVVHTTIYTPDNDDTDCIDYSGQTITHTVTNIPVDIDITNLKRVECGEEDIVFHEPTEPQDKCRAYDQETTADGLGDCTAYPNDNCKEVHTRTYTVGDGCTQDSATTTVLVEDTKPPSWSAYTALNEAHYGDCPITSGDGNSQWNGKSGPTGTDSCNPIQETQYASDFQDCQCSFTRTHTLQDGFHTANNIVDTITYTVCQDNDFYVDGVSAANGLNTVYVYQSEAGGCETAADAEKADVTAFYKCDGQNDQLDVTITNTCDGVGNGESCTYTWTINDGQCTAGSISQTFICNNVGIDDLTIDCATAGSRADVFGSGASHIDYVTQQLAGDAATGDNLSVTVEYDPLDAPVEAIVDNCEHGYSVEFTYTWNENNGDSSGEALLTVHVVDNSPPTWGSHDHLYTGQTLDTCEFDEHRVEAEDTCDDCVDVFETYTETPQGVGCLTKYTKSYKAYDDCGGSTSTLSETWFAGDTTPPTIELRDDDGNPFNQGQTWQCNPPVPTAVVTDNCDGEVNPEPALHNTCEKAYYMYDAKDDCGNIASVGFELERATEQYLDWGSFAANVEISCYVEGSAECTLQTDPVEVTHTCVGVDLTTGDLTGPHTDDGGVTYYYTRTFTAQSEDTCHVETRSQTLTIKDTAVPSYTCEEVLGAKGDARYDAATNTIVKQIDGTTSQTCDAPGIPAQDESCCTLLHETVTSTVETNTCGADGVRKTVTHTYQIQHLGNGDDGPLCTLRYEFLDNDGPVLALPTNTEDECAFPALPDVTATDVFCGVTSSEPVTSTLLTPHPGFQVVDNESSEKVYKYSAADACSNPTEEIVTFTKYDRSLPQITLIEGADGCKDYEAPRVCASDNCPGVVIDELKSTTNLDGHSDTCPKYEVVYTWVATDALNGKTATETATYRVEDNTAPSFHPDTVWEREIACGEQVSDPVDDGTDCHDVEITKVSESEEVCQPLDDGRTAAKIITQVFRATDACNNFVEQTRTLIVVNTQPVITTVPVSLSDKDCFDELTEDLFKADVTDDDSCSVPTGGFTVDINVDQQQGRCQDTYTVTYTTTDACGATGTTQESGSLLYPTDTEGLVTWTKADETEFECNTDIAAKLEGQVVVGVQLCDSSIETLGTGDISVYEIGAPAPQECNDKKVFATQDFEYFFTHECGATGTEQDTVDITDKQAPTFPTKHSDVTKDCAKDSPVWARPGSSEAIPAADATDTCDNNLEVCLTSSLVEECTDVFTHIVTYTATDDACNSDSYSVTVKVEDSTPPSFVGTLPITDTVDCSYTPPDLTGQDTCTSETLTAKRTATSLDHSPALGELSKTEYTYRIEDACGHTTTHTHTITVVDTEDPTITGDFSTLEYQCATVAPYPSVTVSDNCGCATYLMTETTSQDGCATTYVRTFVATDSNGRTSTEIQTVRIEDTTAPVIEVTERHGSPDETFDCASDPAPPVFTVTDNCDNNGQDYADASMVVQKSTTIDPENGEGEITYTITAVDECGNVATKDVTHKYVDKTPPVLVNPGDAEYGCFDNIPSVADYQLQLQNTVTDDCTQSPIVEISQVILPGHCDCDYVIEYTASAKDKSADENEADEVTWTATVEPTASCPDFVYSGWAASASSGSAEFEEEPGRADVSFPGIYSSSPLSVHQTATRITNPDKPCEYQIEYSFSVEDECGGVCTDSFTIEIVDNTPPELYPIPDENVVAECDAVPDACDVKAYDDCLDQELSVRYTEEIHEDATHAAHCGAAGARTDLCYTIVRTWYAEDQAGNPQSITQTIKVSDTSAPSFAPALTTDDKEITVECECDELGIPVHIKVTDNCDADLCYGSDVCAQDAALYSEVNTFTPGLGDSVTDQKVRTYYAKDSSGNVRTFTQTITVRDTKAPVIFVDGQRPDSATETVTFQCQHELDAFDERIYTAFDECNESPTLTTVIDGNESWNNFNKVTQPNNCEDRNAYEVVTTASDGFRSSTHTTFVTYRDNTAPIANRTSVIVQCEKSSLSLDAVKALAGIRDNCRESPTLSVASSTCASATGSGIEFSDLSSPCAVDFTATDSCNNQATLTITFTSYCEAPVRVFKGTKTHDNTKYADKVDLKVEIYEDNQAVLSFVWDDLASSTHTVMHLIDTHTFTSNVTAGNFALDAPADEVYYNKFRGLLGSDGKYTGNYYNIYGDSVGSFELTEQL